MIIIIIIIINIMLMQINFWSSHGTLSGSCFPNTNRLATLVCYVRLLVIIGFVVFIYHFTCTRNVSMNWIIVLSSWHFYIKTI